MREDLVLLAATAEIGAGEEADDPISYMCRRTAVFRSGECFLVRFWVRFTARAWKDTSML